MKICHEKLIDMSEMGDKIVEEIKEISARLWKVISKKKKQEMLDYLETKEFEKAAEILLVDYYDPLYAHTLNQVDFSFTVSCNDLDKAVKEIMGIVNE